MKKIQKLLVIILLVTLLSGCTKYVKVDKKNVSFEETGQNLTDNILCKPTNKNLLGIYEEHSKDLSIELKELPECKDFKVNSNGYSGLWESVFIKPLAWLILKLGYLIEQFGGFGAAIMIIGLAIRILLMPMSLKSLTQSDAMKKAQPKIKKIEKKYENKNDKESLMMKSQDTMAVYKEYKISPISGCLVAFLQLPLFFAFLEAINRLPVVFEDKFLGLNLGMTPLKGIMNHNYWYIIIIALVILSTYFSFKNSMSQSNGMPETEKQMQFMSKFMIIMISIASLSLSTAISLYWIVTNMFVMVQNFIFNKIRKEKV